MVRLAGSATAALLDQNGDQQRSAPASFTVSGCPATSSGGSGGSSGSGGTSGSGGSSSGSGAKAASAGSSASLDGTHLIADAVSGLSTGRPSMRFTVSVSRRTPELERLTVMLPTGLAFRARGRAGHLTVRGVSLSGAKIRALRLARHRLVISLRRDSRSVRVTLGPDSLRETRALRREAETHRLRRLRLKVGVRDAQRRTRTLTVTVRHLRLR